MRFIPGRKAVMTIYDDDPVKTKRVVDEVELHDISNIAALHGLMVKKGFQLKVKEEVERIRADHRARESRLTRTTRKDERSEKFIIFGIFFMLLLICFSCLYCCCRRKRKRKANKEGINDKNE